MPVIRLFFLCLVLLAMSACTDRDEEAVVIPDRLTAIPEKYRPLFDGGMSDDEVDTLLAAVPYRSITLRRSGCFGPCPVYIFTVQNDLKASLIGKRYLTPLGTSTGEIDIFDFGRLCYLLDTLDLQTLNDEYRGDWTDAATATLTIVYRDGRQRRISDYGEVGPIRLWALLEVIDNLRRKIEWETHEMAE